MPDFSKGMEIALNAALKALGLQKEHILEPIKQVRETFEEINMRLARIELALNIEKQETKKNGLLPDTRENRIER